MSQKERVPVIASTANVRKKSSNPLPIARQGRLGNQDEGIGRYPGHTLPPAKYLTK